MNSSARILLFGIIIIVLLHIWGTLEPIHENWGLHFFGFYNATVSLIALGILILFSIPALQSKILDRLAALFRALSKLPVFINFIIVAGILYGGIRLFPAKLHLLGDGAILLRSATLGINGPEITQSFRNQPLMFWIYKTAMTMRPFDTTPDSYTVYYFIDLVAAALFLFFIFWMLRQIDRPLLEKVLLGCLLFFGGGSQFFFGYVENYALQYILTIAFAVTGWFALERRVSIVVPIVCFVVMVLLHLGSLVFSPAIALLILLYWPKKRMQAIFILAGTGVLGIIGLFAAGFNLIDLTRHLQSGNVDFLHPFSVPGGNFPYAMFSFSHLVDWFNSLMLVAPVGLIAIPALIAAIPNEQRWKRPALAFLICTAACGFFFTWVINSALGLARDWDLFSGFFTPLLVLMIYLLSRDELSLQPRRYVFMLIVIVSMLHWVAWIGLNADADKHLARIKILNSPKFLALTTQMVYDEALANYYFDSGRYQDARGYYLHFMNIDSSNTRIVGNIADVYRKLGEKDNYFRMLLRAENLGSRDPGIYTNLGVEYASRGDTARAIEFNLKAVKLNPAMQKANANLGILFASIKNYPLAYRYFTAALNLGMRDPIIFRYAGDMATFLHQYRDALHYYDSYLDQSPTDQRVKAVRDRIAQALREQQPHK